MSQSNKIKITQKEFEELYEVTDKPEPKEKPNIESFEIKEITDKEKVLEDAFDAL